MTDPASIEALRAQLRGELIQPDDAGYDAARKVFNAMIDRRPADHRALRRCRRRHRLRQLRARAELLLAVRGGGHNGGGLGVCDNGHRHRPVAHEGHPRRCEGAHGARRRRLHLGRCRPCDACVRAGVPERHHLDHRRRRADPGRRHRLPVAPAAG